MNSTEEILSHTVYAANNVLNYALKCNLSIAVFYCDVKPSQFYLMCLFKCMFYNHTVYLLTKQVYAVD